MKNSVKLLEAMRSIAITAIVAVIGFSMAACNPDPEPAHVHQWGAWNVTLEANCTTAGSQTRTCTLDATHTETEAIPINDDHDWGEWEGTVTCTEGGTGTRVCSRSATHTQTDNNLQPLGHAYNDEDWEETEPPTCTVKGKEEANCIRYAECGNTATREIAIDPEAHDWQVTSGTAPTCTEDGNGAEICSYNNEHKRSGVLPKLGHDDGEWHTALEPNCTTAGSKQLRCTRDDFVLDTEAIIALGHDYQNYTTTTDPTCEVDGEETGTCTHDQNHKDKRPLTKLGHDYQWVTATAPTCTTAGSDNGTCTHDNSHTTTRTVAIVPTAHNWTGYTITTPSTCTITGIETDTCSYNPTQHTRTQTIAVNPDAHDYQWVTIPPSAIEEGMDKEICTHNATHTGDTRNIVPSTLITNTTEWNNAITMLNGRTGNYTLTIGGSFNVAGSTADTFGTTASGNLTVTLKGSGTLSLSSNGYILRVGARQTVIIDSENLILQGRSNNNNSLVLINGKLELRDGIIRNNTYSGSSAVGGGVYVGGYATFIMSGGTISGNVTSASSSGAQCWGGGVYVSDNGIFTMIGGTISGNRASTTATGSGVNVGGLGGGVFVMSNGTFRIVNGTIYGNTESVTSLRNTVTSAAGSFARGAALYISTYSETVQRGTFSIPGDTSSTWTSKGDLSLTSVPNSSNIKAYTDNTIRVVDGELVQ